jgi:glycosyltransferase involved in cell wall biosynthesis/SAM-dependent methyltransferase
MATDTSTRDLPWTGERYVPQIGGEIELEHLHRYYWAAQFSSGKSVLDIACGEGYGSEILARSAAHVIGVDLAEGAVIHAGRKYPRKNLEFLVGSCDRIPIPDGRIDLVVSFETIEHHDRHQEMMREIKRILRPEGILIISSPDKYVYSDIPGYENPFHVKELYAREFEALLKEHFVRVDMLGQRVAYGSLIAREGQAGFLSFDSEEKSSHAIGGIERAIYNVAIATDSNPPEVFSSIYEQSITKSVGFQALLQEIEVRGSKITELEDNKRIHQESASQVSQLRTELANYEAVISKLRKDLPNRETVISGLRKELASREAVVSKLQQGVSEAGMKIEQLKASLSWRVTWPLRLVRDRMAAAVWRARRALSSGPARAAGTPENVALRSPSFERSLEGTKPHPLFDPAWYLQENPDVVKSGIEPLQHYVNSGWREGRSPHPLFDVRYYLSQVPELAEIGIEPVAHFIQNGARAGLKPNPLFDPTWYAVFNRKSMASGENALIHYATRGWKEGCDPHPSFSISLYLEANPEIRFRNQDPLVHYLHGSHRESTRLMPNISPEPPGADAEPPEVDVKAIALYLPQFHRIPENDAWWGEGFTEWTNVRRGKRQFWGHYQPHVPHPDIGYYDLTDPGVMEKQAQLARQFGIHGFCFYYYWFNGRRLLEMPTDRLLASGSPNFPFCFCWANENWTRRWDGEEREVLMGQEHSYESDERFIRDILPALRDRRYIRINGRPLLAVYRPGLLPDAKATFAHWRNVCREEGLGEIYLVGFKAFDLREPEPFGMDAAVEFPPHHCKVMKSDYSELPVSNDFCGEIYDYRKIAENFVTHSTDDFTLFPGVMPSWDNTARMRNQGTIWVHSNPQIYCHWLHRAVLRTRRHANPDERLIFINSWNEWAEGAHLEPDEMHGYAWLNATRLALEVGNFHRHAAYGLEDRFVLVISHDAAMAGAQVLLLNLLRQWKKRRPFAVRVICVGAGELREEFEKCFPTLVLADFATKTEQDAAMAEFLRGSPRVIYSSTVVNGPLLAQLRPLGIKIVTHSHELQKSIERWAPGEIMAATLKHSDYFLAGSVKVAENLTASHSVPQDCLAVVNDFIVPWGAEQQPNTAAITAMREELGVGVDDVVVFGCGTTDWRKGPDLFVDVARLACARDTRLKFVWIGGDPEPFMEKARSSGMGGRILFVGNRRESRRYYYLGHIFLLSSREDPSPLVALEAADAGLPVVCFAGAGDIPGFVGEQCGAVVPYEDAAAAAEAIVQLAGNPEQRRTQGLEGRKRAMERHSSASAALQIEALFDRLEHEPKQTSVRTEPCKNEALVSVIVPNYNHERYLPERLRSIAEQTYQNMEIILLDDASTDNSRTILQKFANDQHGARFIPNAQNSGSTFKQWRKGLSQARGKYIWIAESDDVAEPELLETLVERLEANPGLQIAYCELQMVSPNGEKLGTPQDWMSEIDPQRWKTDFVNDGIEEIRRSLVVKNTILNASGVVFRNSEGIEDLVDDSMRLCADWLFWVRLLGRGGVAYIAQPLSRWRLNSSNARNRPPGDLEWSEGERVLVEAAQILKLTESERDQILLGFLRKCWKWRKEAEPLAHEPAQ